MGKSTISMAIFNSFLYVFQRVYPYQSPQEFCCFKPVFCWWNPQETAALAWPEANLLCGRLPGLLRYLPADVGKKCVFSFMEWGLLNGYIILVTWGYIMGYIVHIYVDILEVSVLSWEYPKSSDNHDWVLKQPGWLGDPPFLEPPNN